MSELQKWWFSSFLWALKIHTHIILKEFATCIMLIRA